MSDTTLNQFISRGTNAQRLAFTPSPATPASGNNPSYIFYETDTRNAYMWDGANWQQINPVSSSPPGGLGCGYDYDEPLLVWTPPSSGGGGGGSGTVTTTGSPSAGQIAEFSGSTAITGLTLGTGLYIQGTTLAFGASASIRSSGIQSSSGTAYTVNFPTGAAAGDLVILICGSGWGFSVAPLGWNAVEFATQSNFLGNIFSRILTTSDVNAGSVALTQAGSGAAVICAICMVGAPAIKNISSNHNATGGSTRTVTISTGFNSSDLLIYWGMNRNASADTINLGSAVQSINATGASGCVTSGAAGASSVTATMSYSVITGPTTGDYQGIIALSG